jgi:hypothetical protein
LIYRLSIAYLWLCVGASALVVWQTQWLDSDLGEIRIEGCVRTIPDVKAGAQLPVTFVATNVSSRDLKLLGAEQFCAKWGCVLAPGFPVKIPAGSSRSFTLLVSTRAAAPHGPFNAQVAVFSDGEGSERNTLRISGRVVPDAS